MPAFVDPGPQEFSAPLRLRDGGGAYVEVPAEVVAAYGVKGRIPVRARFDLDTSTADYRGSLAPYSGRHILGVLKQIRSDLDADDGVLLTIRLELDNEVRTIEVPDDARDALAAAGLLEAFRSMSYTHQREHVQWIEQAKRPETRAKRVAATVERIAGDGR